MKNKLIVSSILAGILIAIGTQCYIKAPNYIGAFIFPIALLSILICKLDLFTGKISKVATLKDISNVTIILIGNLIGCSIMYLFPSELAYNIVNSKLNENLLNIFVESIFCNILIYIAVDAFKHRYIIITILCVAAFILGGFEHCVANFAFIFSSHIFNISIIKFLFVNIIGNTFGGIIYHKLICHIGGD